MSNLKKRRLRRRRRIVRSVRRTVLGIILAPLKMPMLTASMVSSMMKLCEVVAVVFVFLIIAHISAPELIAQGIVIAAGVAFAILLLAIKYSDYRERLEEYRYYGFKV